MDKTFWLTLKSGSDIRFTAIDTPDDKKNISPDVIYEITNAYVYWLSSRLEKEQLKVAVGHDSRLSSPDIKTDIVRALKDSGCTVFDCGLCSTPSMFMMTRYPETLADGAIMVTASHHPFQKNGLKFFTAFGGLKGDDITKVLEYASGGLNIKSSNCKYIKKDFMQLYCNTLVDLFKKGTGVTYPLKGHKIVVDAGNGAGGFYVDRVLKVLGADTEGSQFLEPDGSFPNHVPNPEDSEAMKSISECVKKNNASLGIIFDTDVDRAAIVASDGMEINRNRLIALISAIILSEKPGSTIVTDSVTSEGLTHFIESLRGNHHRFKRGYNNVINEAMELEAMGVDTPLAIETSGHAAFRENFFLDDGAYLITKILIAMCKLDKEGKNLLSLIEDLPEAKEECEVRISYKTEHWREYGEEVLAKLKKICDKKRGWFVVKKSYEGVRVTTSSGAFLVRMSVHDPVMPLNFEDNLEGGVRKTAKKLLKVMKKFKYLDLTNLINLTKK